MPARTLVAVSAVTLAVAFAASARPAEAFNPVKPICSAAGLFSGLLGKACSVVQHGGRVLDATKKLVTGNVTGAAKSLLGEAGPKVASAATTALALTALGAWVIGGASYMVHETSAVLGETTAPQLTTTWFSASYWKVAGIAAVLTLPFLFAAAVQALVQSDLALLVRAAFGYLPLAALAVTIAAPLTMLLLAGSDQMSAIVSSAVGHQSARFLEGSSGLLASLGRIAVSPFVGFFIALITVAAALGLWIELLMRDAAVYVIVLMLPLAFAAFVWPARRMWALRAVELLIALIVSKFVIVAVLSLGGAALTQGVHQGLVGVLAGLVLLILGAFAPWAVLRLLPVTEIATAAAGALRHDGRAALDGAGRADAWAGEGEAWAAKAAQMRREARDTEEVDAPASARENLDRAEPSAKSEADTDRSPATAVADSLATPAAREGVAGVAANAARMPGGETATAEHPAWLPKTPVVLGPDGLAPEPGTMAEVGTDEGPADLPDPSPPPPERPL